MNKGANDLLLNIANASSVAQTVQLFNTPYNTANNLVYKYIWVTPDVLTGTSWTLEYRAVGATAWVDITNIPIDNWVGYLNTLGIGVFSSASAVPRGNNYIAWSSTYEFNTLTEVP